MISQNQKLGTKAETYSDLSEPGLCRLIEIITSLSNLQISSQPWVELTCIDRKHSLRVSFLPMFLVCLTVADLTKRRQNIFPTHNQRRPIMKISQCITHFFNYQRMNVKKKYTSKL